MFHPDVGDGHELNIRNRPKMGEDLVPGVSQPGNADS